MQGTGKQSLDESKSQSADKSSQVQIKILGLKARTSFNDYKITRHSEANKVRLTGTQAKRVFLSSAGGTRGFDEGVQVDAISNPSGSLDESLHEVLELELLLVRHLESLQFFFFDVLAMDPDE